MTPMKKKKESNSSKRNLKSPPESNNNRSSMTLLPQIKTRNSNFSSKKDINKKDKAATFTLIEQESEAELIRRCSSSQAILEALSNESDKLDA